jgi:hypothetical protein
MIPTIADPAPVPPFAEPINDMLMMSMNYGITLVIIVGMFGLFRAMLRFLTYGPAPRAPKRPKEPREKVTTSKPSKALRSAEESLRTSKPRIMEKARQDMLTAWYDWAFGERMAVKGVLSPGGIDSYVDPSPRRDWTPDRLTRAGCILFWVKRENKDGYRAEDVEAKLKLYAARITDTRADAFDTMAGLNDQEWLVNPDPKHAPAYREAYLAGGRKAVDEITTAIQLSREAIREEIKADAARQVVVEASNAQLRGVAAEQTARLAALRETYQPTAALDAHAQWEKEANDH